MTDQDERLERLAAAYATEQGFPRKGMGVGRESYNTLMRYEIRDYVAEAYDAGYRAALEGEDAKALIDAAELGAEGWERESYDDTAAEIRAAIARFCGGGK